MKRQTNFKKQKTPLQTPLQLEDETRGRTKSSRERRTFQVQRNRSGGNTVCTLLYQEEISRTGIIIWVFDDSVVYGIIDENGDHLFETIIKQPGFKGSVKVYQDVNLGYGYVNLVGDTPVVAAKQHIHLSSNIGSGEKSPFKRYGKSIHSEVAKSERPDVLADTGGDIKLDESDLPVEIFDAKLDDTDVLAEGSGEDSAQDLDAGVAKTALNAEMDASVVLNTVAQPNSVILAITPANQGLATSGAIKLSRKVDPAANRTFGVLTKVDLMDKGTNALDVSTEYVLFNPSEMDEINNSVLLATQQHVPQFKFRE
ncbi:hypothetical protein QYF36_017940 [Acer negundo]|nr:hypothetical protein QYF36_017940 [Acer negundo]